MFGETETTSSCMYEIFIQRENNHQKVVIYL